MSLADPPTLEQVLTLAQRLHAADRLRLIAQLAPGVVAALPVENSGDADADAFDPLDELEHIIAENAASGPLPRDSADVISEMRR
jgi:hypothetical protein